MLIRFTKGYTVRGSGPDDSPSYKEGQEVDVSEASARHFINRGVAVDASKAKAPAKATASDDEDRGYEEMHVDELHKLASDRNIEGRSALTTKSDLISAIEKDDKAKARAKAAERQQAAAKPADKPVEKQADKPVVK